MIAELPLTEHTDTKPYIPLRRWQTALNSTFRAWVYGRKRGDSRTFVAAVSGGAGKTYAGAFIAKECELMKKVDRVIVVCPSNTIVNQWVDTLNSTTLSRNTIIWDGNYTGVSNIVTTYHMMSNYPYRLKRVVGSDTLIIFDECHHLADSAAWGNAVKEFAEYPAYRLFLTATAFREDDAKIPYVTYTNGVLQTNFEYSYGEALNDGYVRPVYFKALDADSRWKLDDKLGNAQLMADSQSSAMMQQAFATALIPTSQFMQELIGMAHSQLEVIRTRQESANAAGIITCRDQLHARQVQRLVQKLTHSNPVLVISDDPDSDNKLDHFRESDDVWLIVVRKGSEGLDIPRLRVGVYATNILTELYFLQFLFRLVRQLQGAKEDAYLYMPAHPKLIEYAKGIREMRVHALKETVDSPVGERDKTEKGQSTVTTPIASEPGTLVHIDIDANSSPLEKLIKIRELAARTIDNVARGLNRPDTEPDIVLEALKQIAEMVGVTRESPLAPANTEHTLVKEFERKRQWLIFKKLFNQLQAMPLWYRDVLSYLWNNIDDEAEIIGVELAAGCNMPVSRFTSNWKRDLNPLIETGLLATDVVNHARVFQPYMHQHLSNICPDYQSDELMSYLLTGKLPEEQ
jgi:superfamily II DNA or RNA helicase